MKIKPLSKYILLRITEPDEVTTASGIVTGLTKPVDPTEGVVEALGADIEAGIKVGDTVGFKQYAEITTGEKELYMVEESDLQYVWKTNAAKK